jgi:tetratricopeptide (TPR) repeat protein
MAGRRDLTNEEVMALRDLLAQSGSSGAAETRRQSRKPRETREADAALTDSELTAIKGQAEGVAAAADAAARAADKDAGSADGLFEAGRVWEFTIMPGRALDLYSRALKLDPSHNEAQARLAINLIRAGRKEEGLRVAADLADRAPEFRFKTVKNDLNVSSQTLLGDALRVNGDIDGAIRAYETALELEPGDAHSAARLAELYLVHGRVGKAADLDDKIDDVFNPELKATLRLSGNDRALLPAITQIRLNAAVNAAVV